MPQALTDRSLRSLINATTRRRDVWDTLVSGFGVRLSPGGHCAFVVRYRIHGRLRRFTIGPYPRVSLADARQTARDTLRDAQGGVDIAREKIDARLAETFAELADEYIKHHAAKKRSGREDIRILKGSPHRKRTGKRPHVPLVARWGALRVKEITRRDVRELLDEIAARAPVMANRTLALVRKMFNFAIERDWLESNPCQMVKPPGQERQRDRVLSEDEIRRVWSALDAEAPAIAALFRLRLLTAQRGGEVHGAAWSEMDLSAGWWTIPAERSKNGLAHRVPLSPPAVQILKALRLQGEKAAAGAKQEPSLWIFPSRHKRLPHMAHAQKAIERVVASSKVAFRGHDLRRTAASLMVGAGVSRLVVSKILNHVETGVTAVYDRHSYDREKREALDFWGRRLSAIVANKRQKAKLLRFSAAS
ncbi:MAG: tyrosine-type recombinase/integrase [Vicinamibacterales bacterium]